MEEIEQEKDESAAVTGVRCVLDQAERGDAGPDAAQFAVEIGLARGLPRRERRDRGSDRRVFMRPRRI